VETLGAYRWLTEHGAMVHVVSPRIGEFDPTLGLRFPPQCATHVLAIRLMEHAGWLKIDRYTDEAKVADYDSIPDALRMDPHARALVSGMYEAGNPTCAICHGQWVMVSAKILKGKHATAVWNIQIDVENAGATVLDEPCVVDGNLITARWRHGTDAAANPGPYTAGGIARSRLVLPDNAPLPRGSLLPQAAVG
jgi:protease I